MQAEGCCSDVRVTDRRAAKPSPKACVGRLLPLNHAVELGDPHEPLARLDLPATLELGQHRAVVVQGEFQIRFGRTSDHTGDLSSKSSVDKVSARAFAARGGKNFHRHGRMI